MNNITKKISFGSLLNWLFLFICISEWPLGKILGVSFAGYRLLAMLATIGYNFSNPYFRQAFFRNAPAIWGVWTLYSVINWFICPHSFLEFSSYFYIANYIKTYAFLSILYYEASFDFKRSLMMLFYFFIVFLIIGYLGQGNAPVKDSSSWEGRSGTLLGNHYPNTLICGLFAAMIACISDYISKKQLILFTVCVTGAVLWVATRKAFYGIFLLSLFYALSSIELKKGYKLKFIGGGLLLYIVYEAVVRFTLLGARMNQINDFDFPIEVPEYLSFLGDRAIQYVIAWNVFLEHPINGVGLGNSMDYTGLPFPLHTEYMEHLCEGGIIGFCLYLWFIITIARYIFDSYYTKSRSVSIMCSGGLAMILFISLTAWLYNMPHFFVVYAIIIAYCKPLEFK